MKKSALKSNPFWRKRKFSNGSVIYFATKKWYKMMDKLRGVS